MRRAPSTAVMTGNLTKTVLAFLETATERQPLLADAKRQLKNTVQLVIGFFVGCLVGAGAVSGFGEWAWAFPVALAGVAVTLVPRKHSAFSSLQSAEGGHSTE
jgi:uncharacterized membrane protein YoaK (UPF0700 family)